MKESGFSARVYQGPSGEIVIAYAGKETENTLAGTVNDYLSGNVQLAAGLMGVWFNQPATVLTPVPFEHSASSLSLAAADKD